MTCARATSSLARAMPWALVGGVGAASYLYTLISSATSAVSAANVYSLISNTTSACCTSPQQISQGCLELVAQAFGRGITDFNATTLCSATLPSAQSQASNTIAWHAFVISTLAVATLGIAIKACHNRRHHNEYELIDSDI